MDTTDPDIVFDAKGQCNHCNVAIALLANHWFPNERGREKLEVCAQAIRREGKGRDYDSIIGISGGVDSSYLLHVARSEMDINPLVVHVDAGWDSEIAVKNIENLVKKLGFDLYTHVIDWDEIRDLQLAYLASSVPNQDVPQDHAFFAILYEFAVVNKIKYVITGSNYSSESILPLSWGSDAMDDVQLRYIHKKFGKKKLESYPVIPWWKKKIYYPYLKGMKVVKPLNWMSYDKTKAIDFLSKEYGWRYYGGKHHESRWTKFFQSYYLPKKFGYDKRRAHHSSLIVSGQTSRAAALAELEVLPYQESELANDLEFIAKKLGISVNQLEELISLPNKSHADYPNNRSVDHLFTRIGLFSRKILGIR